ncbi:MAG TPA: prepilin-type N-terminal cleavage/methylation domain-containing protein [Nitrospirota bacterium]|nr:prepilin-type N-terminal cleavage/methylation domain-containing protein [Nitrospirota bacterium]
MTVNNGRAGTPAAGISSQRGFTMMELLIVMAIMGILLTIAQPSLRQSIVRAREAVLKENLFSLREAIDQYYADYGKYPDQLADLTSTQDPAKSYMRSLPKDPFTNAADWITVAPAEGSEGGIFDVHSASPLVATDGTAYNTW